MAAFIEQLWLRARAAASLFNQLNTHLATKVSSVITVSAGVVAGVEMAFVLSLGLTMIQVGEYAIATFLWLVLAVVFVLRSLSDTAIPRRRIIARITGALVFCTLAIMWTDIKRKDESWTVFWPPLKAMWVSHAYVPNAPNPLIAKHQLPSHWNSPALASIKTPEEPRVKAPFVAPAAAPVTRGPRLATGPEAYKDLTDEQVADWTIEDASKIAALADDYVKGRRGPPGLESNSRARTFFFSHAFNECCAQDLKDLRAEVLSRLGPPGKDPDEQMYWDLLFSSTLVSAASLPSDISPYNVLRYAPYLRRLGIQLRHRGKPRTAPRALNFYEQQITAQHKDFPYEIVATITTDAEYRSGYLAVEFSGHFAGAACDCADCKLVVGTSSDIIDNQDFIEYLQHHADRGEMLYALAIGKTPLSPQRPMHVGAYSKSPVHVSKVTLFEE